MGTVLDIFTNWDFVGDLLALAESCCAVRIMSRSLGHPDLGDRDHGWSGTETIVLELRFVGDSVPHDASAVQRPQAAGRIPKKLSHRLAAFGGDSEDCLSNGPLQQSHAAQSCTVRQPAERVAYGCETETDIRRWLSMIVIATLIRSTGWP